MISIFLIFVGDYNLDKKIIESKFVASVKARVSIMQALIKLSDLAKDNGFDAMTNIGFMQNNIGYEAYGNIVKFG